MPVSESWIAGRQVVDVTVLLTVFKRKTLGLQLRALAQQTVAPREIVVYHDGDFRKIPKKKLLRQGIQVTENSFNTKFHGRFAYLLNARTEWVTVLDDDIIPGPRCIESYLNQAQELDAIVGGMGRIARTNAHKEHLYQPGDVGVRPDPVLVDFVGHMWFLRKKNLYDMFAYEPVTYETGEDMHLCFSSKLRSGTPAYVAAQPSLEHSCDTSMNKYADDDVAAYLTMPKTERENVEAYFSGEGVSFITPEQQEEAAKSWLAR